MRLISYRGEALQSWTSTWMSTWTGDVARSRNCGESKGEFKLKRPESCDWKWALKGRLFHSLVWEGGGIIQIKA